MNHPPLHAHSIPGLRTRSLSAFQDHRGAFVEIYRADAPPCDEAGQPISFMEDDISISHRHVLRGLHGDRINWKLLLCLQGEIFLAIADLRAWPRGPYPHATFHLKAEDLTQILIPPGCATGYLCLSASCIVNYKQSQGYVGAANQLAARWDDPALSIDWPKAEIILSERDRSTPDLPRNS